MPQVTHLSQALTDIKEIVHYLADEKMALEAALSFYDELETKSQQYARQPEMGTLREDLLPELRCFSVKRWYLVFYRETNQGIEILRVLHGARDFKKVF